MFKTDAIPYFAVWKLILSRYAHPFRDMSFLGAVLILHTLLSVAVPYVMKEIVDQSQSGSAVTDFTTVWSWSNLYVLAAAFALGWLLMHLLNHLQSAFSAFLNVKFDTAVLYTALEKYFMLKHSEQKKIETGVITTDLWRGADAFSTITYTVLFILLPIILQIVVMVVVLTKTIGLVYSLIFLVFAVLTFLINIVIAFRSQDIFTHYYDAHNQANQFLTEKIQNHYDVQVNAATTYEMQNFDKRIVSYQREVIKTNNRLAGYMAFQVLFLGVFLFVFMMMTVYLFKSNSVTTGDFVLISSYIVSLTMPLLMVSQNVIRLKGSFIALNKMYAYLLLPAKQLKNEEIQDSPVFYQFRNCSFYLGKNRITDFNLQLCKGRCYVAMGQTGIGKTSFIHYLTGMEQIESGELFYKNIDISEQFSAQIFQEIAVVAQSPCVYSGTLRDNLIHNSPYAYTDEELNAWLERFGLAGILRKNQLGLDDDLQNIYQSFSGGERQRISIIRALLKKPAFLILDEPTAALDEQTSMELMAFIREQVETVFMISHATYARDFADSIIDFDQLIAGQD